MKGTLKIGTRYIQPAHLDTGVKTFGLYIQKGKNRWWHLPTLGGKQLKRTAQLAEGKELHVSDRAIWDLEDCTCTRCAGTGLYAWAFENGKPKASCSGPCHQCQGKGYLSYSDERRTETYWEHRVVSA